ncbi:lecithin retinol acyltransferase family protein [Synechococcus sp. M16CYN]|uniref:lecithin retinol acyltransferase family protein n=1 Tax=Synechococcus sp. M16CYN TaxID=3103139 RepID=UPI0030E13060
MAVGDHLQVPRQHGLFNHHGIDLGDNTVAHYLEGREILRSPFKDFSQAEPITVIKYQQPLSAGITIRRAMSRIGEQNYNLLFNNCEHFATWCKTGRHRSRQVDSVVRRARYCSRLMPSVLINGLELLVQRGVLNDNTRQIAGHGVAKLEKLRQALLKQLEILLQQASSNHDNQLLITGQGLADELAAVEDLKKRINAFLKSTPGAFKFQA